MCGLGGIVLGSRGKYYVPLNVDLLGGILRQMAYGTLGAGVGTTLCYPNCTLKAVNYAWDASTSKIIEASEKMKRR